MKRRLRQRKPARGLTPQIKGDCLSCFPIRVATQRLRNHHRRDHTAGVGEHPDRREQVLERVIGEQLVPMIGEELEHRTRWEHVHGHRLNIQKLTLTIITTPHNSSLNPQPAKSHHRASTVQINQQSPRTCRISRSCPMFPRGISDGLDAAVSI